MKGWRYEGHRHSLAARGIKTSLFSKAPRYNFDFKEPRLTGKTEWDNPDSYFEKAVVKKTPVDALAFLDKLGVNTDVPEDDVDYYVKMWETDEEKLRTPYVVLDSNIDVVDYGNISTLRAAERLELDEVPFIVIKQYPFKEEESFGKPNEHEGEVI